jgi:hypothetical protein
MINVRLVDGLYAASLITGPTHNYLALGFAEAAPAVVEALPSSNEPCCRCEVSAEAVLAWVTEAAAEFNAGHGAPLHVARVCYHPGDTSTRFAYLRLATAILAHVHGAEHAGEQEP